VRKRTRGAEGSRGVKVERRAQEGRGYVAYGDG
jgi:hypothetical protein